MRRSICITEPPVALAGKSRTWHFVFVTATTLPAKTALRFDPLSKGEADDWQLPDTNSRSKSNVIWLSLPNEKSVFAKRVEDESKNVQYEFVLPVAVNAGEKIVIHMGSPAEGATMEDGNMAQTYNQRRRPFHLYIDPKGKGEFKEPEIFHIDVRGNVLKNIRVIAPSIVFKNSRFDIVVRFEDIYGNLTSNAPEGTLIELTYDQLRENLSWKLFVPETGFINLPNLYFNEEGTYRLKLRNMSSNETFISPPIKCFLSDGNQLFWGQLHGDAKRYDTLDDVETALRHFRDHYAFQFFSTSPNEDDEGASDEQWKLIANQVAEFNEEERFVTMLGFQWTGEVGTEGHRHLIYAKDNKPLLRKKDQKSNSLKKIYKSHNPKDLLSIPSFTMGKSYSFNFEGYNPEFERVVEIYNSWGSSECLSKKTNPKPIKSASKKGINEIEEGSIRNALNQGCRFGFVAGGDDTRGVYQNLLHQGQEKYTPGLTAILAPEYSRDALFQALYDRSCYATTGKRIVLSFNIAEKPMGSELNTKIKPGLHFNRHIHGFVAGTTELAEIDIFRNGEILKSFKNQGDYFEFALDDSELLEKITLSGPEAHPHFVYYYLRVIQKDGHMAWGSPIWIDMFPSEEKKKIKKKV